MPVKTFKISSDEEKQLNELMKQVGETNLSNFIRRKIFESSDSQLDMDQLISKIRDLNRVDTLEKIYETLYRIQVQSEAMQHLDAATMEVVMECVSQLVAEVDCQFPLSISFKEKWT